MDISPAIIVFMYGLLIGSLLNVCIYRIPKHESIITTGSHCNDCGHSIAWYDMIPLLSCIILRGKCRFCGTKISIQYPIVELLNALSWTLIYITYGINETSIMYMLLLSILLVISVIDVKTMEIPISLNIAIGIIGFVNALMNHSNLLTYLLGATVISGILLIVYCFTAGQGVGGGDIKLLAAAGLLLGFPLIYLAFIITCITGSIVQIIKIKLFKGNNKFALGPYISIGIFFSIIIGPSIIDTYLSFVK